jgi:hypothetical protein
MKLQLKEVLEINQGLEKLSDVVLDAQISFKAYSIRSAISGHVENYQKSVNDLIIKKYGEKESEKSDKYIVPQGNMSEYIKELDKLLGKTINVDAEPLSLSELSEAKVDFKFFELMGKLIKKD